MKPQLASTKDPLDLLRYEDCVVELKLDGHRAIVQTGPTPRVWARSGAELTDALPGVTSWARSLPSSVLDGELVAERGGREGGHDVVNVAIKTGQGHRLRFVAFDLLRIGDIDCRPMGTFERRALLEETAPAAALSQRFRVADPAAALDTVAAWVDAGWEGAVVKRLDAPYQCGRRVGSWRKIRLGKALELAFELDCELRAEAAADQKARILGWA